MASVGQRGEWVMTSEIYIALNTVSLIIGIALVLWGLQIYRVYIIFLGLVLGGLLGTAVGGMIGLSPDAAVPVAVAGVLLGGLLAWPLQKLCLFVAVGAVFGLPGAAVLAAMQVPPELCLIAGIALFAVSGAIAVLLFRHVVIILMAFAGAHRIFSLLFHPYGFHFDEGPIRPWRQMLGAVVGPYPSTQEASWSCISRSMAEFYSPHTVALAFIALVCICFGWYFQRTLAVKHAIGDWRTKVIRSRRATYLVSLLTVVAYPLSHPLNHPFEGSSLLGVDAVSWPLVALAVGLFCNCLMPRGHEPHGLRSMGVCRFLAMLIFSVSVVPLITWSVWCVLSMRVAPSWYYGTFLVRDPLWLVIKWTCSLIVFPGVVYLAVLRNLEEPHAEPGVGMVEYATLSPPGTPSAGRHPVRHVPRDLPAPERTWWSDTTA
jgi:hypothetical protein